ncbi:MAG: xanthine dehydrogenase small subunit [Gammaproteobacteria bacterium]|nr:xanthine dehydrogenase small subunit [Gammaproteobacteria bacterium]
MAVDSQTIRFFLGEELQEVHDLDTNTTVLNYLRLLAGRRGAKEGCAEGDCGACTVVVGRPVSDQVEYRAVNACIQLLPTLDGCQLLTVEDIRSSTGELHPVQQALLNRNGTQCGFCTPGIVMSLLALSQQMGPSSAYERRLALVGNLCRCTGYGPILDAAEDIVDKVEDTPKQSWQTPAWNRLKHTTPLSLKVAEKQFFAPQSVQELIQLLDEFPGSTLLAGGTDIGLWVTKQQQELDTIIYLGNIAELQETTFGQEVLTIGATATYQSALPLITEHLPALGVLIERIGSVQIRNVGTIGGNIANGSPIGDMPPPLIALNATLYLQSSSGQRSMPLEDFFIEYGKQARRPGEFVEKIGIPSPPKHSLFNVYKVSKRFDQDISAVCGAFHVQLDARPDEGREPLIVSARICFGGMAGTPARARYVEQSLQGNRWNEVTIKKAQVLMDQDYAPITDMRASATYRLQVAKNLLRRFYLESYVGRGTARIDRQQVVSR